MKIPIQDAIEILNMEGYDIPETDEEIYIDIPEEFTIEELYEVAIKGIHNTKKELWEMTTRGGSELKKYFDKKHRLCPKNL